MTYVIPGISPQHDRLVIKPTKQEEKSKGGLHLGGIADRNPPGGIVLALGPDVKLTVQDANGTRPLRPGDRVIYDRDTDVDYYIDVTDSNTKVCIVFSRNVMLTLMPEEV